MTSSFAPTAPTSRPLGRRSPFQPANLHHQKQQQHASIFDASDEAIQADGIFPSYRQPALGHENSWSAADLDKTPTRQEGYFSALAPPKPVTLEPYLAPPPSLVRVASHQQHHLSQQQQQQQPSSSDWSPTSSPYSVSPPGSSFPFPAVGQTLLAPRAHTDASTILDGSMSGLSLSCHNGLVANGNNSYGSARLGSAFVPTSQSTSPGGSSDLSSAFGLEDGSASALVAAGKDAALQLLSRKIAEMEARLNDQSSMMLRLRDENLLLKDRCRREASGATLACAEADSGLQLSALRDCRTEPGTPVDTAVKCAMGVIGDYDYNAFGPESTPHPEIVARILSQSFSYSLVLPQDYRALTWTLAHRTQRSAQEGHALKFAANFLITKVQQLRGQPMEHVVHDAILAEVVSLSQTANGNYLVQQLLDCAGQRVRTDVYEQVRGTLLALAGEKYGTHVVCKMAEFAELRPLLVQDLVATGVAETFQTGARRLWKAIFDHCKKAGETAIFELVLKQMEGKWADCATTTENGTISVQQVFESWPSIAFMEPVLVEIIQNIARIANGGWGHFLISKLLSNPTSNLRPTILMALLESPAPVAVGHHGISFLRTALLELGRPGVEMYVDTLCSVRREGQSPQIVEIAGSVVGPGHISFLWTMLSGNDKNRLKDACRSHIVSIRSSQSGNDLLRQLGLMPSNTISKLR